MTPEMWQAFDETLLHKVKEGINMEVEVTEESMGKHLQRLTTGFQYAINKTDNHNDNDT